MIKYHEMKPNNFAEKLNTDYFGIETERFRRIVIGLRGHEANGKKLYPDSRSTSEITATQVAHLLHVMALNLNPFASGFHLQIAKVHCLKDEAGKYFIESLARFLSNIEEMSGSGLQRVSFSLDRDSVVFVYREPFYHEALKEYSDITHFVVREHDQVFGERGEMKQERFSILKISALREIAGMLSHKPINTLQ